jgi:hypothetical protein
MENQNIEETYFLKTSEVKYNIDISTVGERVSFKFIMKPTQIIITILLYISINFCYGQSFINGDLDGVVSGLSCLPSNWQNVPFDDINCLGAQIGNDTPDLTSLTGPDTSGGGFGNAFSGSTFLSGIFASNQPNFFQEGIMQNITGFNIGQSYSIIFRQTVNRNNYSLDNSGSWAVYIDTILADITTATYSNEPYNSTNLQWEARSITFTATAISHLIKFLPMDDDSNWFFSNSDTTGALYMGIDSINLIEVTGISEKNKNVDFNLFPNPFHDLLRLNIKSNFTGTIKIVDPLGREIYKTKVEKDISDFSIDLSNFPNGFYLISYSNDSIFVHEKIIKE